MTTKQSAPTLSLALRVNLAILVGAILLMASTAYYATLMQTDLEAQTSIDSTFRNISGEIVTLTAESADLAGKIDGTGKSLAGTFMSKEQFIAFVGGTSQRLGLAVNKYAGGSLIEQDGITTMNFQLEVEGTLQQLEALVESIDLLGTPYAINSLSMRKSDDFVWLDRNLGAMEVLDWTDMDSIAIKRSYTEIQDPEPIGIRDIMGGDLYRMYIDVSFISSHDTSQVAQGGTRVEDYLPVPSDGEVETAETENAGLDPGIVINPEKPAAVELPVEAPVLPETLEETEIVEQEFTETEDPDFPEIDTTFTSDD